MPCAELVRNHGLTNRFNPHRFSILHRDGRHLILHWFKHAWQERECAPQDSFEPFIFSWIALNGWAACCTELDQDRQWLDALIVAPQLYRDFEDALNKSLFLAQSAHDFHALWPVFKAQELRRLHIMRHQHQDRLKTVEYYLREGAHDYAPECWERHRDNGEDVPLDWPHILAVLYRVRCNLFHGDKAPHSEIDCALVSSGFRTLVHFLSSAGYLD
jgi:hypothetical protein